MMSKLKTLTPIAAMLALSVSGLIHATDASATSAAMPAKMAMPAEAKCGANRSKHVAEAKCGAHKPKQATKAKREENIKKEVPAKPKPMDGMSMK